MINTFQEFPEKLTGTSPKDWLLLHGPTKLLVNTYHWHDPKAGIVASYTPTALDVEGHFDVFRGVDQVESFAQSTIVSCATFGECQRMGIVPYQLGEKFAPVFISIGQVNFQSFLEIGQTFVNIGQIKFYKFRQMICDGRIYKVPYGLDLNEYFKDFTEERLLNYDISSDFTLIAELTGITGRAISREVIKRLSL